MAKLNSIIRYSVKKIQDVESKNEWLLYIIFDEKVQL